MKLYASKSNARRAAKQAGLEQFNITEVEGKFGFEPVQETPVVGEFSHCPHCGIHLDNGWQTHFHLREEGHKGCGKFEYLCLACNGEFGPEVPAKIEQAPKEAMKGVPYTDQSTVTNPVKAVWHIADEMFDAAEKAGEEQPRRKDVIAECVNRGIAFYTARTQYQQWWLCRNGKF